LLKFISFSAAIQSLSSLNKVAQNQNNHKILVKEIDQLINDNLRDHIQEQERSVVDYYAD
jgi:hypothetical protein